MRATIAAAALMLASCGAALATGYAQFVSGLPEQGVDDPAAIAHFTAALADPALTPSLRAAALYDRGDAYLRQRNLDAAYADYTAGLALKPDFDTYLSRGGINEIRDKRGAAIADYNAAIALRPDLSLGYEIRSQAYLEIGAYGRALGDANKVMALQPSSVDALLARADVHRVSGDLDAAMADVDKAIADSDGTSAGAFVQKADIQQDREQLKDAIDTLTLALKRETNTQLTVLQIGIVQWENKQYGDAERTVRQALDGEPDQAYALIWLAILRGDAGIANDDVGVRAAKLSDTDWPRPLIDYLLGTKDREAVLAAADTDVFERRGRQCEAEFYTMEFDRIQGKGRETPHRLRALMAACPLGFIEPRVAAHILRVKMHDAD